MALARHPTVVGKLLVGALVAIIAVRSVPAGQTAPAPQLRTVLDEAIVAAQQADDADRVLVLVNVASMLESSDPQRAVTLLSEAATRAEALSEGESIGVTILKGVLASALNVVSTMLVFPLPWWTPLLLFVPPTSATGSLIPYDDPLDAVPLKAHMSLAVVEKLAPHNPKRAFQLAASIDVPRARAHGFYVALREWSEADRTEGLDLAGKRATEEIRQKSAVAVSGLARGVAPLDTERAKQLIREAVALSSSVDISPLDAIYVYETVASMDRGAAEMELERLTRIGSSETDLLAFAAASREAQPDLAWRALKAATRRDDDNKTRLMQRAGISRELSNRLSPDHREDFVRYNLELLDGATSYARPLFSYSPSPFGVVASMDALTALAGVDAALANARAEKVSFPTNVTRMMLQRNRIGSVERFPADVIRLELALSRLGKEPREAFVVLESLDRAFWEAFASVAFRWSGIASQFVENAGPARLLDQLRRLRTEWPSAAQRLCSTDAETCRRGLARFRQVAEWLDIAAIDRIADEQRYRALWASYLPFSLTIAAEAYAEAYPTGADEAIQRSLELALQLPSPSREWALAWNAVVWNRLDSSTAQRATVRAIERLQPLHGRAGGRDWWEWSGPFVRQLAILDPAKAHSLASEIDPAVRGAALAAVASGMTFADQTLITR